MVLPRDQLMNKDSHIIVSMMEDLGIVEYDPKIVNQLLEFNYKYATQILEDSKNLANYVKKNKEIDVADAKLAISMVQDGLCFKPPTREAVVAASHEVNKIPLPKIKPVIGMRIPGNLHLAQANYVLRNDLFVEDSTPKINTITTAAQILEASKFIKCEEML